MKTPIDSAWPSDSGIAGQYLDALGAEQVDRHARPRHVGDDEVVHPRRRRVAGDRRLQRHAAARPSPRISASPPVARSLSLNAAVSSRIATSRASGSRRCTGSVMNTKAIRLPIVRRLVLAPPRHGNHHLHRRRRHASQQSKLSQRAGHDRQRDVVERAAPGALDVEQPLDGHRVADQRAPRPDRRVEERGGRRARDVLADRERRPPQRPAEPRRGARRARRPRPARAAAPPPTRPALRPPAGPGPAPGRRPTPRRAARARAHPDRGRAAAARRPARTCRRPSRGGSSSRDPRCRPRVAVRGGSPTAGASGPAARRAPRRPARRTPRARAARHPPRAPPRAAAGRIPLHRPTPAPRTRPAGNASRIAEPRRAPSRDATCARTRASVIGGRDGSGRKRPFHATCMCALAVSVWRKEASSGVRRSGTRHRVQARRAARHGPAVGTRAPPLRPAGGSGGGGATSGPLAVELGDEGLRESAGWGCMGSILLPPRYKRK